MSGEGVEFRDLAPLGFPGYRVDSEGNVFTAWERVNTQAGGKWFIGNAWRPMNPGRMKNGYRYVCLKGRRWRLVHHLVLGAFIGPRPDGMEGCHKDGDPTNNRLDNLRWDTPEANHADKARHGTLLCGERIKGAKLTADRVLTIRTEYAAGGVSQGELARRHGVNQSTVSLVVSRRVWAHVG